MSKEVLIRVPGSPCRLDASLGWIIYDMDGGSYELPRSPQLMVNFMTTAEHNAESSKQLLDVLEQGLRNCDESVGITKLLIEDKKDLGISGRYLKKIGDHYSVGLLWKDNEVALEENRSLADRRLETLRKRFIQNPELFEK